MKSIQKNQASLAINQRKKMNKGSKFALGTIAAATVGYVAGILTAPSSGTDTRKKIKKTVSQARIDSEKQLKKLYGELQKLIDDSEAQIKKAKAKTSTEFKKQLQNAKKTKQKTKMLLTALHSGEASDPDLKKMLAEANKAKTNLSKFVKK